MPPRAWTTMDLGTEQHRRIPVPSQEIKMQNSGSGMQGGRKGIRPHLYARQLSAPRRAAIFNSKACLLWETRNTSCDSSAWEPPVGTAAFYTRSAHQLSTFKKRPSPATPGAWPRVGCGLEWPFHYGSPGAHHSAGRIQHRGVNLGLHEPRGSFTSGHLSTSATR